MRQRLNPIPSPQTQQDDNHTPETDKKWRSSLIERRWQRIRVRWQQTGSGLRRCFFASLCWMVLFLSFLLFAELSTHRKKDPRQLSARPSWNDKPIPPRVWSMSEIDSGSNTSAFRALAPLWTPVDTSVEEDGQLVVEPLLPDQNERRIMHDFIEGEYYARAKHKRSVKTWAEYFAFDDDVVKHPVCRRPSWYYTHNPACNLVHEFDLLINPGEFLGYGHYREVWTIDLQDVPDEDVAEVVIKMLQIEHEFVDDYLDDIRRDAMVMSLLKSSPRIIDIYAHCGTSVIVESMEGEIDEIVTPKNGGYAKQEDLNDTDDVNPQNNLTAVEKLDFSIQIARSLADLHGYEGGVIVHDDVQLTQWLFTNAHDRKLKLTDFNRAEVMLWNPKAERYCKYRNGPSFGNVRHGISIFVHDIYLHMVYSLLSC